MPKIRRAFVIESERLLGNVNNLLEAEEGAGIDHPEEAEKKIVTSLVAPEPGSSRMVMYVSPQALKTYGPAGGNKVLAEVLTKERGDEVTGFFNNPYHAKNKGSFLQLFTNDFNLGALNPSLGQRAVLLNVPSDVAKQLIAKGAKDARQHAAALTELLRHKHYVATVIPGKLTTQKTDSTDVDEVEKVFNIEAVVGYTDADVRQAALDARKKQAEKKSAEAEANPKPREDEDMPAYKFADIVDSHIAEELRGKMPATEDEAKALSAFIRKALNDAAGDNPKVKRSILKPEVMKQIFPIAKRRNHVMLLAHGAIDDYLTMMKKPEDDTDVTAEKPAAEKPVAPEKPEEKPVAGDLIQQIINNYGIKDAASAPDALRTLAKELQRRLD